ncbi:hypothetical protein PIIN_11297 [Serendipita indica DSM 11827]|uniref:Uncharacterized protein n=1 Tax=Serendipita indica (strain DSM 11827) TaxID=1109443 RepID=G4U178_SERID|nr:hypothetical protein PIIN_11297 [Serendipita indica DSM 11827]
MKTSVGLVFLTTLIPQSSVVLGVAEWQQVCLPSVGSFTVVLTPLPFIMEALTTLEAKPATPA